MASIIGSALWRDTALLCRRSRRFGDERDPVQPRLVQAPDQLGHLSVGRALVGTQLHLEIGRLARRVGDALAEDLGRELLVAEEELYFFFYV